MAKKTEVTLLPHVEAQDHVREFLKHERDECWNTLIEFFLPSLLKDQVFLFSLLTDRANLMAVKSGLPADCELRTLLDKLRLKIELA